MSESTIRTQVKLTKRGFRLPDPRQLTAIPEDELRPVPARTGHFLPVVNTSWVDQQKGKFVDSWLFPGAWFGGFLGLPAAIAPAICFPSVAPFILAAGAGVQAIWVVPTIIFSIRAHRGSKQNFNAFLTWLHDRYGITLNAKQKLVKEINEKHVYSHSTKDFTDDRGRRWVLRANWDGERYVTERGVGSEYDVHGALPAAQPKAKSLVVDKRLPKDLLALHMQVQQLVQKLDDRALTPESQHAVERATRDSMQVVNLYGDLHELGAVGAEQQAQMRQVLNQLLAELKAVLEAEINRALSALALESSFAEARVERKGLGLVGKEPR